MRAGVAACSRSNTTRVRTTLRTISNDALSVAPTPVSSNTALERAATSTLSMTRVAPLIPPSTISTWGPLICFQLWLVGTPLHSAVSVTEPVRSITDSSLWVRLTRSSGGTESD